MDTLRHRSGIQSGPCILVQCLSGSKIGTTYWVENLDCHTKSRCTTVIFITLTHFIIMCNCKPRRTLHYLSYCSLWLTRLSCWDCCHLDIGYITSYVESCLQKTKCFLHKKRIQLYNQTIKNRSLTACSTERQVFKSGPDDNWQTYPDSVLNIVNQLQFTIQILKSFSC